MSEEMNALITEIAQRLRRIETKVHKTAVHVGAEPIELATAYLTQGPQSHGKINIKAPGYDVTLSQIRRFLQEHEVPPGTHVRVTDKLGRVLASLTLHERE